MTLQAGDIILTGTPEGLANVQVGDEVVTEIEGVGSLKNTIIGELEKKGEPEEHAHVG
jgi:5-oxopent-3-ene-1,2,5-tricarboxylate decarboxylase/2-hydroxyhepta-2,4-diene-1,7-dioate isomerase